jgi:hypothetical protein
MINVLAISNGAWKTAQQPIRKRDQRDGRPFTLFRVNVRPEKNERMNSKFNFSTCARREKKYLGLNEKRPLGGACLAVFG